MFSKKQVLRPGHRADHSTPVPVRSASFSDVSEATAGAIAGWPLSEGEVNAFFWFMQGSIMVPETRHRLWTAWGFCERHAWGYLAVEAAFRPRFLMGPTILYLDLIERALRCLPQHPSVGHLRRGLANKGPCMMCEMNVYGAGPGAAPASRIERGRSVDNLRTLAVALRTHWQPVVCGRCSGNGASFLCRPHLLQALRSLSPGDVEQQRRLLVDVGDHLEIYDRSFDWDRRNTEGPEDRAALFTAVGWLSGWGPLLTLF